MAVVETLMENLSSHGPTLHAQRTPVRLFRARDGSITLVASDATGLVIEEGGFA